MTAIFVRDGFNPKGIVGSYPLRYEPAPGIIPRMLNQVYAAFNRGSGQEIEFPGPSMSVGDYIVLNASYQEFMSWSDLPAAMIFRVASVGFDRVRLCNGGVPDVVLEAVGDTFSEVNQ